MICPSCGSDIPEGFRFCGQCGAKLAGEVETPARQPDQRREVAVLFADISGFTAMSEKLDPEDVHQIMNRCFEGLGGVIQEEGGYIDKYIGDNVMALFGAPVAHEDDPARACRAALGMQSFLAGFSKSIEAELGVRLRARVGINYGLVVAGGVGSEVRMDYTVMGDTVNLASRLESAAAPGSVLVSQEIWQRTHQLFEFADPVELTVKGKSHPVRAYELFSEAAAVAPAAPDAMATPPAGRHREIAALQNLINSGSRWVEVVGDIGLGKTRVVRAALAGLSDRRTLIVTVTPAISRRPLGMLRRLIRSLLGEADPDFASVEALSTFREHLSRLDDRLETYALALWYLAAPSRLAVPPPQEAPEAFRRTVEIGTSLLLNASARALPDLICFIDGYGQADDPSVDLLEQHAGKPDASIPPIITATRPTPRESRITKAVLKLDPLDESSAESLLDALTVGVTLPAEVRSSILRRAAGVPLFLEEIVRGLVESGGLVEADAATPIRLPSSLRAAMVSRLDRLPNPERELLGFCSVQGTEFRVPVLDRVYRAEKSGEPNVLPVLEELQRRGVVTCAIMAGDATVHFVQPLMQEACYQMLLRRDRKRLHALTATALCDIAGGETSVEPELLAHHYKRSENWEPAAAAQLRAADRTADLFLNEEALAAYGAVSTLLENAAADSPTARRTNLLALRGIVRVRQRTGNYPEAQASVEEMERRAINDTERSEIDRLRAGIYARTGRAEEAMRLLSRVVSTDVLVGYPNPDMTSLAWYGLAELQHRANRMDDALYALRCCRATATARENRTTLRADLLQGSIAHTRGQFEEATRLYSRALAQSETLGVLGERARAVNNLGNVARDQGNYDEAARRYREALDLWSRIGDTECIAGAHNNLGNLALSTGDFAEARHQYQESLEASLSTGNVNGAALAHANLGMLALEETDGASAVSAGHAALGVLAGAANHILRGLVEVILGDGHLLDGNPKEAEHFFRKVLSEFTRSNHPLAVASAERGLGRAALLQESWDEAEKMLSRAAEGFKRLQRSQEEARTHLDRAQAALGRGDVEAARQLTREALDRFEQIAARRDADRARRMLSELEERGQR